MSNMSYCRFENTVPDLRDCAENLTETPTSKSEFLARKRLVKLCREIVEDADFNEIESEEWHGLD